MRERERDYRNSNCTNEKRKREKEKKRRRKRKKDKKGETDRQTDREIMQPHKTHMQILAEMTHISKGKNE